MRAILATLLPKHSMENTEPVIYDSTEDILAKEIKSWKGFEYALREESRILFNKCYEKKAHILV